MRRRTTPRRTTMAVRRPRRRSVQVCPQCGSGKLVFNSAMIGGQVYHCLKCDYIGSLVFERELEDGEVLKE